MSESTSSTQGPSEQSSREEMHSALFAHMIMQQSNMAMLLLGKVPHPESGKMMQDLDAAKLFIDQLEMLQEKTRGNLSKEEANLLRQSLMSLHMAFVEAVNATPSGSQEAPEASEAKTQAAPTPPASEESHKKFSKKY